MTDALGSRLGQEVRPIDRVAVYVPGGRAAYPSTVLMTVIPARVAGVKEIVLVSPPSADKSLNAAVLAARVQSTPARAWQRSDAGYAASPARRAERHVRGPAGRARSHRDHIHPSAAKVRPADRQCHPEAPGTHNRSAPA
jgi:hypothetical protein